MLNDRQRGFSIIEVIVAMGILSFAATMSMNFIMVRIKDREKRTNQSIYRYLAIQTTQTVTMDLSFFPPMTTGSGSQKVVYVGCFNKKGEQIRNNKDQQEFQFYVSDDFKINDVTGVCDQRTSYEVRFFWLDDEASKVLINIVNIKSPLVTGYEHKNYTIFAK